MFHERVDDGRECLQRFLLLAIGQDQLVLLLCRYRLLEPGEIQRGDDVIRDDQNLASRNEFCRAARDSPNSPGPIKIG